MKKTHKDFHRRKKCEARASTIYNTHIFNSNKTVLNGIFTVNICVSFKSKPIRERRRRKKKKLYKKQSDKDREYFHTQISLRCNENC